MKTELERYKEAMEVATSALRDLTTFGGGRSFINGYAQGVADNIDAILNPPPETEEVEVKRWECKTCGTVYKSQAVDKPCCLGGDTLIPLTGTYKRPKPQPVEKIITSVVQWVTAEGGYIYPASVQPGYPHWEDIADKTGTLTFTWTEPAE